MPFQNHLIISAESDPYIDINNNIRTNLSGIESRFQEKSLQMIQLGHKIQAEEKKFQSMKILTENLENELATVEKRLESKISAAELALNLRDLTLRTDSSL